MVSLSTTIVPGTVDEALIKSVEYRKEAASTVGATNATTRHDSSSIINTAPAVDAVPSSPRRVVGRETIVSSNNSKVLRFRQQPPRYSSGRVHHAVAITGGDISSSSTRGPLAPSIASSSIPSLPLPSGTPIAAAAAGNTTSFTASKKGFTGLGYGKCNPVGDKYRSSSIFTDLDYPDPTKSKR